MCSCATSLRRDKTPYKTHLGIRMWEGEGAKFESSGYYFHLEPPNNLLRYNGLTAGEEVSIPEEFYSDSLLDYCYQRYVDNPIQHWLNELILELPGN